MLTSGIALFIVQDVQIQRISGAFIAATGALLVAPNAPSAGAAFLALGGSAALGVGWWRLKGWASQRQAQFSALVGRYRGARILPPGVE